MWLNGFLRLFLCIRHVGLMGSLSFIGHLFLSGALDKKTCVLKRLDHVHKNIDTILGSIVNITIGGLCVTYFMWTVF